MKESQSETAKDISLLNFFTTAMKSTADQEDQTFDYQIGIKLSEQLTFNQIHFIIDKLNLNHIEIKIVMLDERGQIQSNITQPTSVDKIDNFNSDHQFNESYFKEDFYFILRFKNEFLNPFTTFKKNNKQETLFLDDYEKQKSYEPKVKDIVENLKNSLGTSDPKVINEKIYYELKKHQTDEECLFIRYFDQNNLQEDNQQIKLKYNWLNQQENIYKLGTKYNLFKPLQRKMMNDPNIASQNLDGDKNLINTSESVTNFNQKDIENFIDQKEKSHKSMFMKDKEQMRSGDDAQAAEMSASGFNYQEIFTQAEIQYLLYQKLNEINITFLEVKEVFNESQQRIHKDGLNWTFTNFEDFLTNETQVQELQFLHTQLKPEGEIDDIKLMEKLNQNQTQKPFQEQFWDENQVKTNMRNYQGDDVMWQFLFMIFLLKWMSVLVVVYCGQIGIQMVFPLYFEDSQAPEGLVNIFTLIWAIAYVNSWDWKQKSVGQELYNTSNINSVLYRNPKFKGKLMYKVETDRLDYYNEPSHQMIMKMYSMCVTGLCLLGASTWMTCGLNLNGQVDQDSIFQVRFFSQFTDKGRVFDPDGPIFILTILPGIIQALVTFIINAFFRNIAWQLSSEVEGHKYMNDVENAYKLKRIFFENFDCFIPLVQVVLFQRQMGGLSIQLTSVFMTDQIRRLVCEVVIPFVSLKISRSSFEADQIKWENIKKDESKIQCYNQMRGKSILKDKIYESTLFEEKRLRLQVEHEEQEIFDDQIEVVATFGQFVIFACIMPEMLPLSALFFFIEGNTDTWKIRKVLRRPMVKFKLDIDHWNQVLKFFTFAGILIGGFMFFYTTPQYQDLLKGYSGCDYFKKVELSWSDTLIEKKHDWLTLCEIMQANPKIGTKYQFDMKLTNATSQDKFNDPTSQYKCQIKTHEDTVMINDQSLDEDTWRIANSLIYKHKCENLKVQYTKYFITSCNPTEIEPQAKFGQEVELINDHYKFKGNTSCLYSVQEYLKTSLEIDFNGSYKCFGPKIPSAIATDLYNSREGGCFNYAGNANIYNKCYKHEFNENFNDYCTSVTRLNDTEDNFMKEFWDEQTEYRPQVDSILHDTQILKDVHQCLGVREFKEDFSLIDCEWVESKMTMSQIIKYQLENFKESEQKATQIYNMKSMNEKNYLEMFSNNEDPNYTSGSFELKDILSWKQTITKDDYVFIKYKMNIYKIFDDNYLDIKNRNQDYPDVNFASMSNIQIVEHLKDVMEGDKRYDTDVLLTYLNTMGITGEQIMNNTSEQLIKDYKIIDSEDKEFVHRLVQIMHQFKFIKLLSKNYYGFKTVKKTEELIPSYQQFFLSRANEVGFDVLLDFGKYLEQFEDEQLHKLDEEISSELNSFQKGKLHDKFGYSSNLLPFSQSRDAYKNNPNQSNLLKACKTYNELDPSNLELFKEYQDACLTLYEEDLLFYSFMIRDKIQMSFISEENFSYLNFKSIGDTTLISMKTAEWTKQQGNENELNEMFGDFMKSNQWPICVKRSCMNFEDGSLMNGFIPYRFLLRQYIDLHFYIESRIYYNTLVQTLKSVREKQKGYYQVKPFLTMSQKVIKSSRIADDDEFVCAIKKDEDECMVKDSLDIKILRILGEPPNPELFYQMNKFYSYVYANITNNANEKFKIDMKVMTRCCYTRQLANESNLQVFNAKCAKQQQFCADDEIMGKFSAYELNTDTLNEVDEINHVSLDTIYHIIDQGLQLWHWLRFGDKHFKFLKDNFKTREEFKMALQGDNKDQFTMHDTLQTRILKYYFYWIVGLISFWLLQAVTKPFANIHWIEKKDERKIFKDTHENKYKIKKMTKRLEDFNDKHRRTIDKYLISDDQNWFVDNVVEKNQIGKDIGNKLAKIIVKFVDKQFQMEHILGDNDQNQEKLENEDKKNLMIKLITIGSNASVAQLKKLQLTDLENRRKQQELKFWCKTLEVLTNCTIFIYYDQRLEQFLDFLDNELAN